MSVKEYGLITGATSGIGECMVYELAEDGYHLILVGRNVKKLEELKNRVQRAYNVDVLTYRVEMTDRGALQRLVAQIGELGVKLKVFINNAGIGYYGAFVACPVERDMETIDVNIGAFTYLTKALYPYFEKGSKVLQVASTASFAPGPYMAVYYASKAYVLSLSLALRREWRALGIGVCVLCPGPTSTAFQARADMEKSDFVKKLAMTPEQVAHIAYRGMKRNKAIIIPGVPNKVAARVMEVLPHTVGALLVSKTQKK